MPRRILPVRYLLLLVAVTLATVGVFLLAGAALESQREHDRKAHMDTATAAIRDRITAVESSLEDGAAFINSSEVVTRGEFRSFSSAALERPAIRTFGYAERVESFEREQWELRTGIRIHDLVDERVTEAGDRALYFPARFVEGATVNQSKSVGYDGFGKAERRAAMLDAARSGHPRGTEPVPTPGGNFRPIFYVPVYMPGSLTRTPDERVEALRGFILSGIDVNELARGASSVLPGDTPLAIQDGSTRLTEASPATGESVSSTTLRIGGRTWTISAALPRNPGPERYMHWGLLLAGLLLVVVLWRLFDRAVRQTARAESLVEQRTAELAERNAELENLARFKDRMVGMVSHDLRSPLTAISGYVALLLEEEEGGELTAEQRRWLTVAQRSADRLERQIEDLLLSSHISEGSQFDLSRTPVTIARLATDVVEAAQPFAGQHGIDLSIDADDSVAIEADERRLSQVLDNLVSNAIKYTPDGGRVTVRVASSEQSVSVSVSDTGIGMNEADTASAFEPFARAGEAVDRGIRGTGLGLTIVRSVVEAHGGTVSVHSAPGRGSCFTIELPIGLRSSEPLVTVADRKE